MLGREQVGETKCLAQRYFVLDAEPVENLVSTIQAQQGSSGQEAQQTHCLTGLCPKRVAMWFLPAPSLGCMQPSHTGLRGGDEALHFEAIFMTLYSHLTISFLPGMVSLRMPAFLSIKWTRR